MKTMLSLAALAAASLAVAAPASAQIGPDRYASQASDEEARFDAAERRFESEYAAFQAALERYRNARRSRGGWRDDRGPGYPDNRYDDDRYEYDDRDEGSYDPSRYYRPDARYQERVLAADERVYRGRDGRYYCKRNDGTTGLIVGAFAGGILGNIIDGGHSRAAGTILGAIAGGAAGSAIDRNNQQIRCR
jgi:hypothetical protein